MQEYKLLSAEPAEATCWYGSVTVEVNNKSYDVGVEVETVQGNITLYTEELDADNIELDFQELEEVAEQAILGSVEHAQELKEELRSK